MSTGRSSKRPGWQDLMERVRPGDTIVVVWLDRFSSNFEEGVKTQAELKECQIGIVATKEDINTSDNSASAKPFRRMMLAQAAYQVEFSTERIRVGLDRARAEGKKIGDPPVYFRRRAWSMRRPRYSARHQ